MCVDGEKIYDMTGFKHVYGHNKTKSALAAILKLSSEQGDFPRAHILTGEKGIGKKTLARAFAKALNCLERTTDDPEPCGECLSCNAFESGNHPDTIFVSAAQTVNIGVNDVREQLIHPMSTKPFRYKYKVFIVDKAETLTPSAQNALLKTIEEPALFGVFLFLTPNLMNLLPTIISRCVVHKLHHLTERQVAEGLNAALHNLPEKPSTEKIQHLAELSGGNLGRALEMAADPKHHQMLELVSHVTKNIKTMDILDVLELAPQFTGYKENISDLLDMLYISLGKSREPAGISYISAIPQAKESLMQNGNFQLTIELMLLKVAGKVVVK